MMRAAFESRDVRCLASQEFISIATVMTLSTISSVEAFLSLQARINAHRYTLALWIVFDDSSGWLFHQVVTFSNCFSNVSVLWEGSFKSFRHFLYCVSVSEAGWLSTSQGSTEPGETSKLDGSKDVEVDCCPCKARPIGVDEFPGASAVVGDARLFDNLTLASSASSSKMRCWLALSATGWEGNQDCISWATSFAMDCVASFWMTVWPEARDLYAASLSKSTFRARNRATNSAMKTVVPILSNGSTKVSLP